MYAACARLRPFFFLRFCGGSSSPSPPPPALSRLPSFPSSLSLSLFFFCFLQYRDERGGLSCYLRAAAGDIVAAPPREIWANLVIRHRRRGRPGNFYGATLPRYFFPSSCSSFFSLVCRYVAALGKRGEGVSKRHRLHGIPHARTLSLLFLFPPFPDDIVF